MMVVEEMEKALSPYKRTSEHHTLTGMMLKPHCFFHAPGEVEGGTV